MIYLKQLSNALPELMTAYEKARQRFSDPLYIAWMITCIFDGAAPPKDVRDKFVVIMKARESPAFREFWTVFNDTVRCIENFQLIPMGVFTKDMRDKYRDRFIVDYPGEVPF